MKAILNKYLENVLVLAEESNQSEAKAIAEVIRDSLAGLPESDNPNQHVRSIAQEFRDWADAVLEQCPYPEGREFHYILSFRPHAGGPERIEKVKIESDCLARIVTGELYRIFAEHGLQFGVTQYLPSEYRLDIQNASSWVHEGTWNSIRNQLPVEDSE